MSLEYQVLQFHYSDFKQPEHYHPDEDFILVGKDIFAVFDGVTMAHQDPYPDPSPAAKAAQLGAEAVVEAMNKAAAQAPFDVLTAAFEIANQRIKKLNKDLGVTPKTVDHLEKQYGATVGAFGFLRENILYFGQINDCGVMVFDPVQYRQIDFLLDPRPSMALLAKQEQEGKFEPGSKEQHQFFRSEVVNNPKIEIDGSKINFGVMTGEEKSAEFFHYGATHLTPGQLVLFYSDGFIPFVYDQDFIKLLFSSNSVPEIEKAIKAKIPEAPKYQKEKSLVVIKF